MEITAKGAGPHTARAFFFASKLNYIQNQEPSWEAVPPRNTCFLNNMSNGCGMENLAF